MHGKFNTLISHFLYITADRTAYFKRISQSGRLFYSLPNSLCTGFLFGGMLVVLIKS